MRIKTIIKVRALGPHKGVHLDYTEERTSKPYKDACIKTIQRCSHQNYTKVRASKPYRVAQDKLARVHPAILKHTKKRASKPYRVARIRTSQSASSASKAYRPRRLSSSASRAARADRSQQCFALQGKYNLHHSVRMCKSAKAQFLSPALDCLEN